MLAMCVTNAYLSYSYQAEKDGEEPMDQFEFRNAVADALLSVPVGDAPRPSRVMVGDLS